MNMTLHSGRIVVLVAGLTLVAAPRPKPAC